MIAQHHTQENLMATSSRSRPSKSMSVYEQLHALVAHHIQSYKEDLTKHDRNAIEAHPERPFLHITRKLGTWFLDFPQANEYPPKGERIPYMFGHADREHILSQYTGMVDCYCRNGFIAMHYFDGHTIRPIEPKNAKDLIRDYTERIRAEWRKADR